MNQSNNSHKPPPEDTGKANTATAEMAALAGEIAELWQDHLAALASDPVAKADFVRLIEPQRQAFTAMFADYNAMMHHNAHAPHSPSPAAPPSAAPGYSQGSSHGAASTAAASDDGALRLAQLAHRLAALEERVGRLESRASAGTRRRARRAAEQSDDPAS